MISQASLTVYVDFKSPYAYLAVEPTRRLAQELDIDIDWQPFVLDIPSYLGSAKLGASGEVAEQSRSESQWSKVKYAYFDCRRYATLRGMTIRGTVKIWDTNLASVGMLWAKQQGDEVMHRYIDGIYRPFWKRELDVEDIAAIEQVLTAAGADTQGFEDYANTEGAVENQALQAEAFEAGIFGVPTYIIGDEQYFGREHLPRIRWLLEGSKGASPDIAYELMPGSNVEPSPVRTLEVGISLDDPESLCATEGILALQSELDIDVRWHALPRVEIEKKPGESADDRGGKHRVYRFDNRLRDQSRYLQDLAPGEPVDEKIKDLLQARAVTLLDGTAWDTGVGFASLGGYVGSPLFKLGEETFVGRQHLPLIRARLD